MSVIQSGTRSENSLWVFCRFLLTIGAMTQPSLAQPSLAQPSLAQPSLAQPGSHRLELLSGEARLLRSVAPPPRALQKPEGEQFETVNLIEQHIRFVGADTLPPRGSVELTFIAQVSGVDQLSLFMRGADENELSFEFSRDGESWSPVSTRSFVNGTFSVLLPESLEASETARIRYSTAMDFSNEGPPSRVIDRPLAHLLTSNYQLFNVEGSIFDSYILTTTISGDGSINPGGIGALIARPSPGEAGDWVYQTEIDSYLSVYAVGGQYPQRYDELIEVFDPPSSFGAVNNGVILSAVEEAVAVYEELYGPFPYSRLGVYPISDRAGAAIGPQAQILLPWYFWIEGFEVQDPTFEPRSVTYHEIAHQYFFNAVRLHPDPSRGQAWLSEAMAEFSAVRALEETGGDGRRHRWINYLIYVLTVPEGDEAPVASFEVIEHPYYFQTTYLRGSTLVYGMYHRMSDFTEKLRDCVISWRGLFIDSRDMFACFSSMTPKPGYESFSVDSYRDRYFAGTLRDQISVSARWVDDESSELIINDQEWLDALEIVTFSPQGEIETLYPPRSSEMRVSYSGAAALIDPEITTPRLVRNQSPTDVDLNGVIDGQDALDVLFSVGINIESGDTYFPIHLDVDGDGGITTLDLTDIQREMGEVRQ